MAPLRVSLIGLGMAADAHARSLLDLTGRIDVAWAASPSPARTEAFAARYPFPVTNDIGRALTGPGVDAVILLTPPGTHLELGRQALAAGKHLLVEKPLELDLARGEALAAAGAAAGRAVGVVLQHRFRASSRRAAALIAAGALGGIEAATMTVPWWRAQSYYDEPGRGTLERDGGGVLMTQAIHTLDLFRALAGAERVVAAEARTTALHRMECEDFAAALVTLGNGAPGSIVATTAAFPGRAEEITIIGSRGTLLLKGDSLDFRGLDGAAETVAPPEPGPYGKPHDAHRALLADFADAVAEGRAPGATAADALATQRLIGDILAAARR